ncbi:MAG: hypothetical protein JRJ09_08590 [Deltaproteobacteria bacterium]|nr:hypothetical protein [Deltaproteobacteria bacterium]MBW2354774.1 hypothetical protein [Deltaproteobacteria bacterium]HDZ90054.1 hypothetical protein [Deltaproteobacteria bacterium]
MCIISTPDGWCRPFRQSVDVPEKCFLPITTTLLEINEGGIRVSADKNDREGFNVNYYDMPLVDNTTLGDFTYSIVLSDIDQKNRKATVKVVILPEHFYSARNGLNFDQIIGDWMLDIYKESLFFSSSIEHPGSIR